MSSASASTQGVSRPSCGRLVWLIPVAVLVAALVVQRVKEQRLQGSLDIEDRHNVSGRLRESNVVPECVPPSIDEFPEDLFTQEDRQKGYVVIHFLVTAYLCAMLALVCDQYFIPSLEIIAEYLNVPTDVAGATFMAIGTSSPELYSAVIGSFITEGDIGVGTVVGSAVFNILGVTSVTGLLLWRTESPVDWYPISRDCLVYIFSVAALILVIQNNIVTWFEASLLIAMFGVYISVMYFNHEIEQSCTEKMEDLRHWWKRYRRARSNSFKPKKHTVEKMKALSSSKIASDLVQKDTVNGHVSPPPAVEKIPNGNGNESDKGSEDSDSEDEMSPWTMPSESSTQVMWWFLTWPALLIFSLTIPSCKRPRQHMFAFSFLMSVVWIGAISYLCSWMVTIIGFTFGLPDSVAGITLLAAGISVPEIIASVIVVKNGMANMALCNLIGSNIFDILFCLGVPWLIKTLVFSKTGTLVINSSALTYTTATLLSTVILLFLTLSVAGWKLNWKVGLMCLVLYIAFLVLACMCELNVFGDMNPPTCPS